MADATRLRRTWTRNRLPAVLGAAALTFITAPPAAAAPPPRQLLVRCDDVGMCHAVNVAVARAITSGIPFSASVMFACPWYLEAVELLAQHPEVPVGVHLTLNSEWSRYRWGPVRGRSEVPALRRTRSASGGTARRSSTRSRHRRSARRCPPPGSSWSPTGRSSSEMGSGR